MGSSKVVLPILTLYGRMKWKISVKKLVSFNELVKVCKNYLFATNIAWNELSN